MSTIHFVGGEKGGVGKSVVARVLAQRFIDHSVNFSAVDADTSHGALLRYYADYTRQVDLEAFESADQIMDRALGAERRVLVDLPSQSARILARWLDASDIFRLAEEMSIHLTFWHVSDGGFDSVKLLGLVTDLIKDKTNRHAVLVKNLGRSGNFAQLDDADESKRFIAAGGRIIELPGLDSPTMYAIDRHGSSLWAAINTKDGPGALTPMERRRAKLWLERAYGQLEQVSDLL